MINPGSDRGSALVEFAMVGTILVFILFAAIDFGRVFHMAMALTNAARAGAQYGSQSLTKSTDTSGMKTAALNSISADISSFTVSDASAGRRCECDGTLMTCPPTGTCAGTVRIFVTVTAAKIFSTITHIPGIPWTVTLTRAATLRVQ